MEEETNLMDGIYESAINEERIFLKKSKFFGWRIVHPYKVDGKINWKNLITGGYWTNLIIVAIITTVIIGFFFEYSRALTIANDCLNSNKIFNLIN